MPILSRPHPRYHSPRSRAATPPLRYGATQQMAVRLPDFDHWIDAMAPVLRLDIAPEYRPGVKANLKTAAKMAALLEKVPLDDDVKPAPVYRA
jgi:hypothetical protein